MGLTAAWDILHDSFFFLNEPLRKRPVESHEFTLDTSVCKVHNGQPIGFGVDFSRTCLPKDGEVSRE